VGARIRGLIAALVLLAAGVFVGSAISQWNPLPEQDRPQGLTRDEILGQMSRDLGVEELGRVRVEVLNAGGVQGAALEATGFLRDLGFDVVDFGNADTFDRETTAVIDRSGRPEAARAVSRAMGADEVVQEPDPNLYVDVTVLLGSAWTARLQEPEGEAGADVPWWDLRRRFR